MTRAAALAAAPRARALRPTLNLALLEGEERDLGADAEVTVRLNGEETVRLHELSNPQSARHDESDAEVLDGLDEWERDFRRGAGPPTESDGEGDE